MKKNILLIICTVLFLSLLISCPVNGPSTKPPADAVYTGLTILSNEFVKSFITNKAGDYNYEKSVILHLKDGYFLKDSDNPGSYIDVTNWFAGLADRGITASKEATTEDNLKSVVVVFTVEDANKDKLTPSTKAFEISPVIPASATSFSTKVGSNDKITFFITRDPNAENEADKPKATISNGLVSGFVSGRIIEPVSFTITLEGDCIQCDLTKELLDDYVKYSLFLNNADISVYNLKAYLDGPVKKGATSFSVSILSEDANLNNVVSAPLVLRIPGISFYQAGVDLGFGLLCNSYSENEALDYLPTKINSNAIIAIMENN